MLIRVQETVESKRKNMPTLERVMELLSYSADTGVFTWLIDKGSARAGSAAGAVNGPGYLVIRIDGLLCLGHRLAWLYVFGAWPDGDLDHVNQIKTDNRIANLRVATRSQNEQNKSQRADNSSGYRGVCWSKKECRWKARIQLDGKCHSLGLFDTPEAAYAVYLEAAAKLHTHNPLTVDGKHAH
ncbi:HNH endonuclease [Acidovorax sp.]|uniref:HNH endonuclease n=1 Tax=Acidovorax sp. TaxID=1872122 RepID=UPI0025B85BDB|nr:HNH endonuclease [Acidovorax sp.]MBW8464853.1 HNH endonuclease [Acidovorax sp.]